MVTGSQTNGTSSLEIGHSNQELIISKGRQKKRVLIIVASLIGLVIVAIIIASIFIQKSHRHSSRSKDQPPTISLEEVLNGALSPRSFNATWISGDELLYRNENGDLLVYSAKNRSIRELLPNSHPILQDGLDHELSPDKEFLMVSHDYHKLYRHSYVAQYTIINLQTLETIPVRVGQEIVLQYATWGPKGNAVVFVLHNNIYYKATAVSEAVAITTDGILQTIHNGIPDWVYEEEVFSSNRAVWFSPNGKQMAYAKFNDSLVPYMTVPVYGQPGSLEFQYTRALQIRYPKPGTKNPDVSLHVVDLDTLTTINLPPPEYLASKEPILAAVAWATNEILTAIWMNRIQNEAAIVSYDAKQNGNFDNIKALKQSTGWIELFKPPVFSKDGSKMLLIFSHNQKDNAGGYRHLTLFPRQKNAVPEPLTSGLFVVTDIIAWDEDRDLVYYQANSEDNHAAQHVYSVSTSTKKTTCISCKLTNSEEKSCLHNNIKFSADNSHYVINCGGPGLPETNVYTHDHKKVSLWNDNSHLTSVLEGKALPETVRLTFEVEGGFKALVNLKLPPGIDKSGETKYPMLVNVYGGPDSNQISEKFNLDWGTYLSANRSIIYASIDGRGSGLKGDKMLYAVYRKLGTVEIADQINVTKQIQQSLPYVDPARTAIWGWSYGGYASGMALAIDKEDIFKCAISVAPVTDWALYDSIYTERFMGLPRANDNLEGYSRAQLLNKFEGLRGKKYFLVHGTLDDNVHYQQSMLWSKVLEQKDILFRQQSYPDEDHGLASVRPHLYHTLEKFLDDCFQEEDRD